MTGLGPATTQGFEVVPDAPPKKSGPTLFILAGVFAGIGLLLGGIAWAIADTPTNCSGDGFECAFEGFFSNLITTIFTMIFLGLGSLLVLTAVILAVVGAVQKAGEA